MATIIGATLDLVATNLTINTTGDPTTLAVADNVPVSLTINGTAIVLPTGSANRMAVDSNIIISFTEAIRNNMFDQIGTTTRHDSTFSLLSGAGLATTATTSSGETTTVINAGDRSDTDGTYTNTDNVVGYPPIPVGIFLDGTRSRALVAMDFPADFTQLNPAIGNRGSVGATIVNNGRTPAVTTTDPIPATVILRQTASIAIPGPFTETLPSYVSGGAIAGPYAQVDITNQTRLATFERTATTRANTDVTLTLFGDRTAPTFDNPPTMTSANFAAFWSAAGRGYSGNLMLANNSVFVGSFPGAFTPIVRIEGNLAEGVTARGVLIDTDGADANSITYTWTRTPVGTTTPTTVRTEASTSALTDSYTIAADDIGSRLDLSVAYTDRRSGDAVTAMATTSSLITGGEVTGDLMVTATGLAALRQAVLSASIENLADPNGLPTGNIYTLEWLLGGTPVRTFQNLPQSLEGSNFMPIESGDYSANLFFVDNAGNREDLLSSNTITLRIGTARPDPSGHGLATNYQRRAGMVRSHEEETKGPVRKGTKGLVKSRRRR